MKKKKNKAIEEIRGTILDLGFNEQDLEDIEILAMKDSELVKCEGTCISCQSGCETNS